MPKTHPTLVERLLTEDGRRDLVQLLTDGGVSLGRAWEIICGLALQAIVDPQSVIREARARAPSLVTIH